MTDELAPLQQLALAVGIQSSYIGYDGRRVDAPVESVMAALRALGHDVNSPGDARAALHALQCRPLARTDHTVIVVREPQRAFQLAHDAFGAVATSIEIEGDSLELTGAAGTYQLPDSLEYGRYMLTYQADSGCNRATLLFAPQHCWLPTNRQLGVMLPSLCDAAA